MPNMLYSSGLPRMEMHILPYHVVQLVQEDWGLLKPRHCPAAAVSAGNMAYNIRYGGGRPDSLIDAQR